MPAFWFSLKRSLHCKSQPSDVHDPKARSYLNNVQTRKSCGFGCSRSESNLRDVIHGSKRHIEKPPSCSPRSLESSDFINHITHEVVLSKSTCELKITGFGGNSGGKGSLLLSWVPLTQEHLLSRKIHGDSPFFGCGTSIGTSSKHKSSVDKKFSASSALICKKCCERLKTLEIVETHLTELVEGDLSRKIAEIICRARWLKCEVNSIHIERVLKVHSMQITVAQFEERREMVKIKACKLPTRHPRCLADGNELLRFHGIAIACSLGLNGSSSLFTLEKCGVCQILRHGFSEKDLQGCVAMECFELSQDNHSAARKALLVCRVIAGRVHKPLEKFQEMAGQPGFDSLAGKVGQYSNIEELYLLNPKALLPGFVVIC
ncbi:hypothetical protein P3X46_033376 [Hevea brasiliensis]|uniref:C2H2-type domain-containing protein n=1 Tax=Hevea brasiliensis TaxID=3981 RepID=A0ABQ9KHU6_HEVBR|nr:hypothetical protein P3X46_033376 [Hevea brasiliensis]